MKLALAIALFLLLGFRMPMYFDNDASIRLLLRTLSAHQELAPCVQWIQDNGVVFTPRPLRYDSSELMWGALRPRTILTPPIIGRSAVDASILYHELTHLLGYPDPEAYDYWIAASRVLKAPEWHMERVRGYAARFGWEINEVTDLCKEKP